MITGVVGLIRWGHYRAAAINGYQVTQDKQTLQWSLRATIVTADAFNLRQAPLSFRVVLKDCEWAWPILDPIVTVDGSLPSGPFPITARLGPPSREYV